MYLSIGMVIVLRVNIIFKLFLCFVFLEYQLFPGYLMPKSIWMLYILYTFFVYILFLSVSVWMQSVFCFFSLSLCMGIQEAFSWISVDKPFLIFSEHMYLVQDTFLKRENLQCFKLKFSCAEENWIVLLINRTFQLSSAQENNSSSYVNVLVL